MHRVGMRWLTVLLAAGVLAVTPVAVSAATLVQQTSSDRGVTVRATPRDLSPKAKTWEFEIVLETHSQDLGDDLKAVSWLIGEGGGRLAPTAWEGDPPGGHHRKGVLRFAPLTPVPAIVELRIMRPGESTPRSFRWQSK